MAELDLDWREAARVGYGSVESGARAFVRGIWLQLSRSLVLVAWLFLAGFVGGGVGELVHPLAGLTAGVAAFAMAPVAWGAVRLWRGGNDG
jgi:hypothetical protein